MRSPATNQRRSTRNRRNRQSAANQVQRELIRFQPKTKYQNSSRNAQGVLILSTRKRPLPTAEEIAERKRKKFEVKCKRQSLISLSHRVVALWQFGMHTEERQFGPKKSAEIISFLQATIPQYREKAAAKSFVYRALKRKREADQSPHLEAHRDKRSENKGQQKRKNADIVTLCDELFSEKKTTAPKVQTGLRRNGFSVSLSTIYRVARDLTYKWTKPWHTDVLTPAQKLKRKLFATKLLRLPEEEMLHRIAEWMFSDEKWWDIVGPASYRYCKADTKMDAKMQNQVSGQRSQCLLFCTFVLTFVCLLLCAATPE